MYGTEHLKLVRFMHFILNINYKGFKIIYFLAMLGLRCCTGFSWVAAGLASLVAQTIENPCNVGDLASIPGLERSPGEEHGNPLQYSCLENPHGQRSLEGYSAWGRKELDTTEWLSTALFSCSAGISHHSGFSCFRAQALGHSGLSSWDSTAMVPRL